MNSWYWFMSLISTSKITYAAMSLLLLVSLLRAGQMMRLFFLCALCRLVDLVLLNVI